MATEGLQLFGGDWTERKLAALSKYLKAYVKVLSRTPFVTVYIDAFAGTGYRERIITPMVGSVFEEEESPAEPEPQRFLDGSARIALKVVPPFTDRCIKKFKLSVVSIRPVQRTNVPAIVCA